MSASATSAASNETSLASLLAATDAFAHRHTSPDDAERVAMLALLGQPSLDALVDAAVPPAIRLSKPLDLPAPLGESAALAELRAIASQNKVFRNFIGLGYHDTFTPPVIQ